MSRRRRIVVQRKMSHETLADCAATIVSNLASLSEMFDAIEPQDMMALASEAQGITRRLSDALDGCSRAGSAFALAALLATIGPEFDDKPMGGEA